MQQNNPLFLKKVNKFVLIVTIIIDLCTVAGYLAAFFSGAYAGYKLAIILGLMFLGLVMTVISFFKWPVAYRYIAMTGFAVLYTVALFEAGNDFMFVLLFPIITMYILYFDYKFIWISALIFGAANVADMVAMFAMNGTFRSGMAFEVPVTILRLGSVIIYLAAVIGTTSRSNKNNLSQMKSIRENQEKSQELLDVIVPVVKSVSESATDVTGSMNCLSNNVDATAKILDEIATYNNRTKASVEEQTQMTSEILMKISAAKEESDKMVSLSVKSSDAVSGGQGAMETLITHSEETRLANERVVESVEALIRDAERVAELTNQISGISGQTNLLALNASIESARAGEAGKGFAVVAEEIRKLADDTGSLTKSIQEIVAALRTNADNAKETVTLVVENSAANDEKIKNAEEQFRIIGSQIELLNASVKSIDTSIEEIMESNNTIANSIEQISADSNAAVDCTSEAVRLGNNCKENADMAKEKMASLSDTVHTADKYIK